MSTIFFIEYAGKNDFCLSLNSHSTLQPPSDKSTFSLQHYLQYQDQKLCNRTFLFTFVTTKIH